MARETRPTKIQKSGRDFSRNDRMVALVVKGDSDGPASFFIYQHLLCNASPFFKAAFQGEGTEQGQTSLCLPSVDHDTMNHVVPWLYSGDLSREAGEVDIRSLFWIAAQLNTFALTYELSGLTDEAIGLLEHYLEHFPSSEKLTNALPNVEQIVEIYRKSPATNALRIFVVEFFATALGPSWYAHGKLVKDYPQKCPEFTADLLKALGQKTIELKN
ncbi:hypothetical protein BDR22DRAFT_902504 [Usnea florida]